MQPEEVIECLRALREEAAALPLSTSSAEFNSWQPRVRSLLTRALGEHHHITERFIKTQWTPTIHVMGDRSAFEARFRATIPKVQGILDAAVAELELLADEVPVADAAGVDAELWEHIAPEVGAQAWGKVASQAAIFTEDRVRKWAAARSERSARTWRSLSSGTLGSFGWGVPKVRCRAGSSSLKASPKLSATRTHIG